MNETTYTLRKQHGAYYHVWDGANSKKLGSIIKRGGSTWAAWPEVGLPKNRLTTRQKAIDWVVGAQSEMK
jgi:hypothetical protein